MSKRWMTINNRRFVVESISLGETKAMFARMPTVPLRGGERGGLQARARDIRRDPPAPRMARKQGQTIQLAKLAFPSSEGSGVGSVRASLNSQPSSLNSPVQLVWDPVTVNGSLTNHVFRGDSTWFLSGPVYLYGQTVLEGGSVLKSTNGTSAGLTIYGTLKCDTGPYRPSVLTAKDSNAEGETISGSTGNPEAGGNYGGTAISYQYSGAPLDAHDLRISYKNYGIGLSYVNGEVRNCQFYKVNTALSAGFCTVNVRNVLMNRVASYGFTGGYITFRGEHITLHQVGTLGSFYNATLNLTNCLFVSVTNFSTSGGTFTGAYNATNSSSGVFQVVGGGNHYLTNNSPYRNAGTTNISTNTLAILKRTTTYPPIVYSNATISVPTTLGPQAQRDTDVPDLGYHYDPLDYAFGGSHASNTLTFAAGTAVGWWHNSSGWQHAGQGIQIADRQLLTFDGTAKSPCYWVRCNTVQEQGGNGQWQGGYGPGGITSWNDHNGAYTNAPTVRARFLICSGMALCDNHFRDDWSILIGRFRDCEFYSGGVTGYNSSYYFTNCLFYRQNFGSPNEGRAGNELVARNCTLYGGLVYIHPDIAIPISIKDCAFDGSSFEFSAYGTNTGNATYDYNAYTNATNPFKHGGSHDKSSVVFNWQTGPLGNYYLPTNSVLINAGDVTADVHGLYHFTTQTNQAKELNSTNDICYHYAAVDGNGKPLDDDSDGVPDYREDANGNGSVDSGETDWQSATDLGLKVFITRPRNGVTIP